MKTGGTEGRSSAVGQPMGKPLDVVSNPNFARFQASAGAWDEDTKRVARAKLIADRIRSLEGVTEAGNVLDIGCGTGLLTLELSGGTRRITAVDISPKMLEGLAEKCKRVGADAVRCVVADVEVEPWPGSAYDLITSSATLHHIRDVDRLLASCVGKLKRGGWLAIADLEWDASGYHSDETGVVHMGFVPDDLAARFRQVGLSNVQIAPSFSEARSMEGDKVKTFNTFLVCGRLD